MNLESSEARSAGNVDSDELLMLAFCRGSNEAFGELSYAEIAEVLQLPVNTVRSRLFRARMALRDLLAAPVAKPASELTPSQERI